MAGLKLGGGWAAVLLVAAGVGGAQKLVVAERGGQSGQNELLRGPSTASLAIKLQETPLRMTLLLWCAE